MNRWNEWWGQRSREEQRVLRLLGAVIVLALLYLILFEPAWSGRQRLRQELPRLRNDIALMQVQAAEARQLGGGHAPSLPNGPALVEMVSDSMKQRGLVPQQLARSGGGGIRVTLNDVAFADWIGWLEQARQQYRLKVAEAHVTPIKEGHVNLTAVLAPPGS